jgi:hypothetical protein
MLKKERGKFLDWASGLAIVPALSDALGDLGLGDILSDVEKAGHSTINFVAQLSDAERRVLCKDMSKNECENNIEWAAKLS